MSEVAPTTDAPAAEPELVPELIHGAPVSYSRGEKVVHPTAANYVKVIQGLYADGFRMAVDLTAVDYLTNATRVLPAGIAPERFEVVVNLLSHAARERIRVRVQLAGDSPRVASLYGVYPGTEAMEREAFDLLGIWFDDHPDLTRILLPDDWQGHPLRKDEATGRIPVQFTHNVTPRTSA
jgi:NADH-quinone oxidoreductase subunit C